MPTISQFYGITISMFFNDNDKHHIPHVHIQYAENNATFDLKGNLIAGVIPNKQRKLVEAWIEIHNQELNDLWNAIQKGAETFKIEPLR